jgi:serine/threonine-protein kinase
MGLARRRQSSDNRAATRPAVLGNTIGNYKVTARLGEGGMGVVYLAEHPALGRKAAIKVLRAQMAADPQVVSRFFQEARASNAIRHPNIVDTYDFGTLPDGASYIIMEYLEGESLQERLRREGRLSLRSALDFVCQAAAGLAAAHEKGIVHRDLKPDNVFVTPDPRAPGHELIKILDFGIAKLGGEVPSGISHKTRTGTLMGTPLYMSPEQCLGVREVDHRTDIYSLGCILYEMLCGAPPFVSEGFGALINMHINQPPDPPARRNPDVTPVVQQAVLCMLAKEPADRFGRMVDVQEVLSPLIVGAPATLRPLSASDAGRPLPRLPSLAMGATTLSASATATNSEVSAPPPTGRRRRGLGAGAALAALVLGGLLVFRLRPHGADVDRARGAAATPAVPAAVAIEPSATRATAANPPAADALEIALDSDPPGALVTADGEMIGTTPMRWRTLAGHRPVTLAFALDGYRREVIQAVPSAGLRLAPALKRSAAHHPRAPRPAAAAPPAPSIDDIKSER